jgi:hypothetical protein
MREWKIDPTDLPWLDQPDAPSRVAERSGEFSEAEREALQTWIRDGAVLIEGAVPCRDIDSMQDELEEQLWRARTPRAGWTVYDLQRTPGDAPRAYTHEEILSWPESDRLAARDRSNWRVCEMFHLSDSARRIASDPQISRLVDIILGAPAAVRYSINFWNGSQQALHQDLAVFAIVPLSRLVGVWIACEDIDPHSGPLIYYPGSHRVGLWEGFWNYPQTMLRTASKPDTDAYNAYVQRRANEFDRKELIVRKGDALIWHSNLIHGGALVVDRARTRKSFVLHSVVESCDRLAEVEPPFNW